jgi:DNA-binding beta-propeller fold protein YncE
VSRLRLLAVAAAALVCSATPARAGFEDLDRLVFVANRTTAEIAVIDSATDRVSGRIGLAAIPHQFVLSDQTGKLVASHLDPAALSIVDLGSDELQRLDLDLRPEQLAIGPDGAILAVASARDD